MTEYGVRKYAEDEGLGNSIEQEKVGTDLRVYLQNPDGVMAANKELDDRRALLELKRWDVDVIALPETNRNWQQEWVRNKWKREVKRVWPHAKVFGASLDRPAQPEAGYVHGGVSLIITNCWASRIMEHGNDFLGRWVWVTLRGKKQERLTVAAMYRPNQGYTTDGPLTVWAQQRARLQELALERGDTAEVDPRERCLTDLKKWVDQRRNRGDKVVILTDANQSLSDSTGTFSLCNLVEECQMHSVLEDKYPEQTLRSVARGSKTIDHILTAGINNGSVGRAGQLPFGLGFSSDHRGMFADLDAGEILQLVMEEPKDRAGRRLSSKNEKHRGKYIESVLASFEARNVFKRVGTLYNKAQTGELDEQGRREYNELDDCVTQAMLAAEKKLPKKGSRLWTTELGRLIHQARYYRILLRRAKGLAYHQNILRKVKQKANIDVELDDVAEIQRRLTATWKSIKSIRRKEREARNKHLENLINAADSDQKKAAIRQIKYRENTRWRFRRIRNTLNRINAGGLAGVDVPLYGDSGAICGWKSITESNELHQVLVDRNLEHLHQASATPIGHGEGYELFHGPDRHETARAVLEGKLEWKHPIEEVNLFVSNMERAYDPEELAEEVERINKEVTVEEFKSYFKRKDESTESSPSGRHIGHYKAAMANDDLVDVIVSMLNIGLITGQALDRWKRTVSLMLEKDTGQPKLHRLRIIQLFEADYNFLLSLVFGHRLMTFARKFCKLNESQYGSMSGKQAQSAVLNKILTYDLIRLTKQDAATSEFDAAANYDRILPAIAMIACQRLGLAKKPAELLYDSLVDLKHQVKTIYGLSAEYGSTSDHPLYGTGQGSGGSPTFWAVIADILFNSIDSKGAQLVFTDPRRERTSARSEDGYVDDTALGVDGRDEQVIARLTTAAQRHERILYATGGKLALHKCTWVLMSWIWREGEAFLQIHPEDEDGRCTAASPGQLTLEQSENGQTVRIPRLNPTCGYRTLGVWIAADGNQVAQFNKLQASVARWLEHVASSSLSKQDRYLAYTSFLRPQLLYPLGCCTIEYKKLKKLFRSVLDQIMHSLGLNKNFPLALVHAGPDWLGLGVDDLPTMQGVAQLQLLLGHVNKQDRTGELIHIERDHLEVIIGVGKCPLKDPHITQMDHAPRTWITSISEFLHRHDCVVELRHKKVVPLQRDQDKYIMQLALDGRFDLSLVQQCRLFLKVVTIADVINAAGDQLEPWAFKGPGRESRLYWPAQGQPSKRAWTEWRKVLRSLLTTYGQIVGKYLKPTYKLGKWISTHQIWQWRGNSQWAVRYDGTLYRREGVTLVESGGNMRFDNTRLYPLQVTTRRGTQLVVRDPGSGQYSPGVIIDEYDRIKGDLFPTVTSPEFEDEEEDIVIATDGSLKNGSGGAAYIINSIRTPGTLKSVLPVDGDRRQLTSYRTELFAMLGALLTLKGILLAQVRRWDKLSGTVWCDNKSAVDKFNRLEDEVPFSLTIANETDADVLQELRVLKSELPVSIQAAWVKSHQKTCTTREARLNTIADRLANLQHGKHGRWAARESSAMLPKTQAQLIIAGKRYTGSVNRKIQQRLYNDRAREYIVTKLNLNGVDHLVDWRAIAAMHRRLSVWSRVTRLKLLCRWAPTRARLHLVGMSDTNMCPLCSDEIETQMHVFCCDSPKAVEARKGALERLEDELVRVHTHPDITTIFMLAVRGDLDALMNLELSENDDVAEAYDQQRRIGWTTLKYGVVSAEWRQVQNRWTQHMINDMGGADTKRWGSILQDALWAYVLEVWGYRNRTVHGDTVEEMRLKQVESLRHECISLAARNGTVGAEDRHLLAARLDNRSGMYLFHWRRLMRNAMKKERVRQRGRVRAQAEELFREVRTRHGRHESRRQGRLDEFFEVRTGLDRASRISAPLQDQWMGLRNISIPAQRDLVRDVDQPDAAEE